MVKHLARAREFYVRTRCVECNDFFWRQKHIKVSEWVRKHPCCSLECYEAQRARQKVRYG